MRSESVGSASAVASSISISRAFLAPAQDRDSSNLGKHVLVCGGFEEVTRRSDIEMTLATVVAGWEAAIDTWYAPYRRGRIGLIKFLDDR